MMGMGSAHSAMAIVAQAAASDTHLRCVLACTHHRHCSAVRNHLPRAMISAFGDFTAPGRDPHDSHVAWSAPSLRRPAGAHGRA